MMCIHQLQFLESKSLTAVSNRSFALTRLRAVTVIDRALASPAHSWNLGGGPRAHSRAHELYRPGGQVRFTCPPFHNPEARSARPVHESTAAFGLSRALRECRKDSACAQRQQPDQSKKRQRA
jgi:hypothetical protein